MNPKLLKKYLQNNSTPAIRQRAGKINFDKVGRPSQYRFKFKYKGSEPKPYQIEILQNNKIVRSSCSCPYDFGGLCKHEAAALNYILIQSGKQITEKSDWQEVDMEDGLITEDLIGQFPSSGLHHWELRMYDVLKFQVQKIDTVFRSYKTLKQNFIYDKDKHKLQFKCSCNNKRNGFCEHIAPALIKISELIGRFAFSPDYLEKTKEEFLKERGMTLEDDYEEFFKFETGQYGLEVKEKLDNLISVNEAKNVLLPKINEDTSEELSTKKMVQKPSKTHGIGICFSIDYYSDPLDFKLFPFKGKFRKRVRELSTGFKELNDFNFLDNTRNLSKEDRDNSVEIFEVQNFFRAYKRNKDYKSLHKAHLMLKGFMEKNQGKYDFYLKGKDDKLSKRNLTKNTYDETPVELCFLLKENKKTYSLKPKLKIGKKSYALNSEKIEKSPLFCLKENRFFLFKDSYTFPYFAEFFGKRELNFIKTDKKKLYKNFIAPLSAHFEIKDEVYTTYKPKKKTKPEKLEKHVYLKDFEGEQILFKTAVQYPEKLIPLQSLEQRFDSKKGEIRDRDTVYEDEFLEDFRGLHSDFEQQEPPFLLDPNQLIQNQWLLHASEKMKEKGMNVFGANELKSFKYNLNKPSVSVSVSSGRDWFDLDVNIKFGKQKVSLKEVRKALLKKQDYVELGDGSFGVLPEKWLKKFSRYFKAGEVKKDKIELSNYQFNILDELVEDIEERPDFLMELQRKKERLQNLNTKIQIEVPKEVQATLRPYQLEGLNWLAFLDDNELGGCLADDMGLGKTLQAIAFLSYLKNTKKPKNPHLVVAPTSLIFNWEKEIQKFCPSLKTLIYIGQDRQAKRKKFKKYDLILSTYGTTLADIEELKKQSFDYVILDESQAIKNPNSKRYKAVRLLNSRNRLALTGTPIENNTFDLYAQMNFLNPGLLGSMAHFKKEFSKAIDKNKDEEASKLLSEMVQPFLLRRTKEKVATELPEKTESYLYCEMESEQQNVYDSFKNKYRDYLLQKFDENGAAKSQMYVLEGLTKLRQICNSAELLNDEEDYGKSSVKLDLLMEQLKSKIGSHKVVVFSQFTSMLKLLQKRLENEQMTYEYLDGQTRKREEKVNNFQENEDIRIFLISLKAGGTGLNLTSADYVFLIDPWWNPAVENQAIDRCYRIGQEKHVMAYRMICRGTVEEKIIKLQENKKQVSESIIQTDGLKKSFDETKIRELFS